LPVVPQLRVVVVLDDEAAGRARPFDRRSPAVRLHDDAERKLVRGADDRRGDPQRVQKIGARAAFVHRQRDEPCTRRRGRRAVRRCARLLDRDSTCAARVQRAAHER
jgi:hypothetical protein